MQFEKELLKAIDKKKKYTLQEVSNLTGKDIPTIRTWRDLGVFNKDKSKVYRLKTIIEYDQELIIGKDLIDFTSNDWE